MKKYVLIFLVGLLFSCDYKLSVYKESELNTLLLKYQEMAYFEGQKDALNKDIRIKKNLDSCWVWIKSPWGDGTPPIFNPSFNCDFINNKK